MPIPAAPWSFNNNWGQYDSIGDLPNVTGSRLQTNDLEAGHVAWVVFDNALYVCQVATRNAALWAPIGSLDPITTDLDIYLAADAVNASNSGPGSVAEPLLTFDEAIRRTNVAAKVSNRTVRIHIAPAAAGYTQSVTLGPVIGPSPIVIIGDGAGQGDDGFTVLRATAAAAAGTTQFVLIDPVGGMTVNEFQGKTIEVLSGAAIGDRRTIRNNTATDFVPNCRFTAAVAPGDSFRIVEPAVVITTMVPGGGGIASGSAPFARGVGSPSNTDGVTSFSRTGNANPSALLLANLSFVAPAGTVPSLNFINSEVVFAGCEISAALSSTYYVLSDSTSYVIAGIDVSLGIVSGFYLPEMLGLADSVTEWLGWGVSVLEDAISINFRPTIFSGCLVWQVDTSAGLAIPAVHWALFGGELNCTGTPNFNGAFRFIDMSQVIFDGIEVSNAVRVIATGGDTRSAALRAVGGAVIGCSNFEARCTGNGCAVAAHGSESSVYLFLQAGTISLVEGVTLEGVRACAVAMTGGRIYWDENPTVVGVPSQGEAIITQSSTGAAPVLSTTFAGLADGAVVANPDLSGTILGKIT